MSPQGHYSRGYLPHYFEPGAVVAVTFRLADSLPQALLRQVHAAAQLAKEAERGRALANMIDSALDRGHGECLLRKPAVAELVESSMRHFDQDRYRLLAWVVMPNHVHALVQPAAGQTLDGILKSWKGYSARMANRELGRSGPFWQREYFDRQVRDAEHLLRVIEYIHNNPVKARLAGSPEDWRCSSAGPHARGEIEMGGIL